MRPRCALLALAVATAAALAEPPSVGPQGRVDFPQRSLRSGSGAGAMSSVFQRELPVHNAAPFSPARVSDPRTVPGVLWDTRRIPGVPGYTEQPNILACGDYGFMRGPDGKCWRIADKSGTGPGPTNYQALV